MVVLCYFVDGVGSRREKTQYDSASFACGCVPCSVSVVYVHCTNVFVGLAVFVTQQTIVTE